MYLFNSIKESINKSAKQLRFYHCIDYLESDTLQTKVTLSPLSIILPISTLVCFLRLTY